MSNGLYSATDLQSVDFCLGAAIGDCYRQINPDAGPAAYRRFVKRPVAEKIYYARNDDVQAALRKLFRHTDEAGAIDLPAIIYYRQQGLSADMNNKIQIVDAARFVREEQAGGLDDAMRITMIPVTLTYSLLFLAWDRASLDAMIIAWWAHIAPLKRRHSRFLAPYVIDGERFEVGATINSPREVLTSSEEASDQPDKRLWGARTMCEVSTQAVYGAKVRIPDTFHLVGHFEAMP